MCVKPDLSTKIKQSPMVMNPIYLEGLNPQKLYLTVTVANSNPALNPLSPNVSSANFFDRRSPRLNVSYRLGYQRPGASPLVPFHLL